MSGAHCERFPSCMNFSEKPEPPRCEKEDCPGARSSRVFAAMFAAQPGPSDPAQEPEAVALKPCPFCGGEACYEESFGSPTIRCIADHCYVRPIFRCWASKDEVIQQWNTRPVSLDREAMLDRVVKFDECETPEPTLRKMILGYYIQGMQPDAALARKYADRFILALIEGRM